MTNPVPIVVNVGRRVLVLAATAAVVVVAVLAALTPLLSGVHLPAADIAIITSATTLLTAFVTWARADGLITNNGLHYALATQPGPVTVLVSLGRLVLADAATVAVALLAVLSIVTPFLPDVNLPAVAISVVTGATAVLTAFVAWARSVGLVSKVAGRLQG